MSVPSRDVHSLSEAQHRKLAHLVMRRQASLSLRVASVFAVLLFGLPLVNLYWPALANRSFFGFTVTWLFLGVLFYPITILLSFYFVQNSDRIETECADWRAVLGEEAVEMREEELALEHTMRKEQE
jgi:low affinity Fe/Cu permease